MKKVFKFFGYCLIGIIALGVIGSLLTDSGEEETVTTSTEPVESTEKAEEATEPVEEVEETEEVVTVGVGQPLQVGDVAFTVSEIGEEVKLGDDFFSETPAEGAVYAMVYMTIENKGTEALTIDSNYFKLLVDNVEYSPTTSTVLIDEMFFLKQINPNLSKKGTLIFEVPQGTKGTQLHVQTGFWGTETGIINLQ